MALVNFHILLKFFAKGFVTISKILFPYRQADKLLIPLAMMAQNLASFRPRAMQFQICKIPVQSNYFPSICGSMLIAPLFKPKHYLASLWHKEDFHFQIARIHMSKFVGITRF